MYWRSLWTEVAVLNSLVVPISQVVLNAGLTVISSNHRILDTISCAMRPLDWPINDFLLDWHINDFLLDWPINDFLLDLPINDFLLDWPIKDFLLDWPINDFLLDLPINDFLLDWPINDFLLDDLLMTSCWIDLLMTSCWIDPLMTSCWLLLCGMYTFRKIYTQSLEARPYFDARHCHTQDTRPLD